MPPLSWKTHKAVKLKIRCACKAEKKLEVLCTPRVDEDTIPMLYVGWCEACGKELRLPMEREGKGKAHGA